VKLVREGALLSEKVNAHRLETKYSRAYMRNTFIGSSEKLKGNKHRGQEEITRGIIELILLFCKRRMKAEKLRSCGLP
jgi:hypothetical protein